MDEMEAMGDQFAGEGSEEGPELVVCIERYPGGVVKVGVEGDEAGMQEVGSVREAMKVAEGLLEPVQDEGAFEAGFAKTAPVTTEGMR